MTAPRYKPGDTVVLPGPAGRRGVVETTGQERGREIVIVAFTDDCGRQRGQAFRGDALEDGDAA